MLLFRQKSRSTGTATFARMPQLHLTSTHQTSRVLEWTRRVYKYIRKLMALPSLPHCQISPMFIRLQAEAQTEPLQDLASYVRRQWIESAVFLPKNWRVYQQAIRTNNNIEGWHNVLNHRESGQCSLLLHSVIELLDREAKRPVFH